MRRVFSKLIPKSFHFHAIVEKRIFSKSKGKIISGPFQGMNYINRVNWGPYFPKLLGTYEKELHTAFMQLSKYPMNRIVVAGAAEGYYAVGLLRLFPQAQMIVFEIDSESIVLLKQLAIQNEVFGRLKIMGECNYNSMIQTMEEGIDLLVMDIEGAEYEVLIRDLPRRLRSTFIVLEVHDFVQDGLGETILQRFNSTHDIEVIGQNIRTVNDIPFQLNWMERHLLRKHYIRRINEYRLSANGEPMRWFIMIPKGK
jgi:hypothetical protein